MSWTPVSSVAQPGRADRLGVLLSGVCMVHCLLLPVMLSTLPLWPAAAAWHRWLHPVFALILIPTTMVAAVAGYRKHGRRRIVGVLGVGLAVILSAGVLGHAMPGAAVETGLTVAGSVLLIAGHWRNWRADRCCKVATACPAHTPHAHEN